MWKCIPTHCIRHLPAAAFGALIAAHPVPTCRCALGDRMAWVPDAAPISTGPDASVLPAPQLVADSGPRRSVADAPAFAPYARPEAADAGLIGGVMLERPGALPGDMPGALDVPDRADVPGRPVWRGPQPVPEPASWAVLGMALVVMAAVRRRACIR